MDKEKAVERGAELVTIPSELEGLRLDSALAKLLEQYSRAMLKHAVESGSILLNGVSVKARTIVHTGDQVTVEIRPRPETSAVAQAVAYDVVWSEQDFIVVNKPPGLVVHPGAGNPDQTLVNGLLAAFPELSSLPRAGLIHRIDKDTSGLLLVARHIGSYERLVKMMASRAISRTYDALVHGQLATSASVNQPIGRDHRLRTRMRVTAGGRPAVTHYYVKERYTAQTLLEVHLETGRTHQIRVHMSWLGHPLVGDPTYGQNRRKGVPRRNDAPNVQVANFSRQALHAAKLQFDHPRSGETVAFEAPPPNDMRELLDTLRSQALQ